MKTILFSLIAFLCYQSTSAQIVNIEDKRGALIDTSAWLGYIDLKFNLIENGSSIMSINGDVRLEYINGRHLFLSLSNYSLGRVEGAEFIDQGFQHLRYNYLLKKRLTWEAFTQVQYNEKIKLHLRWLLGIGPRFELFNNQKNRAYLGALYMYEYNEESIDLVGQENFHRDHRVSTYLSFGIQPHSHITIAGTTYFQPVLHDFSDIRISSQTSLNFAISNHWAFSSAFSITYDSDVPKGVVHTIYQWTNGLRWNF